MAYNKGDIPVRSSANVMDFIPVGTDGHVLVADSTQSKGVKWAASGASGALVLIGDSGAISSASSVDFTSLITSTYDDYYFNFLNVTSASNNVNFVFDTSNNNGSSWQTNGSTFQNALITPGGTTAPVYTGSVGASFILSQAIGSLNQSTGWLRLLNPRTNVGPYGTAESLCSRIDSTNQSYTHTYGMVFGTMGSPGVDALRFKMSSGNTASGRIYMYARKKA